MVVLLGAAFGSPAIEMRGPKSGSIVMAPMLLGAAFGSPAGMLLGAAFGSPARALRAVSFALATFSVACSSSQDECTCVVDQSGERRTLACGQASCVGGIIVVCAEGNRTDQRGACTPTQDSTGTGGVGSPDSGNGGPPDTSCDDLQTFCSTSCSRPASVSADCQTTASAGDPQACRSWPLSSGLSCMP